MKKQRLDQLLAERGLTESRARAQALIMSGVVFIDGKRVDKPGTLVSETAEPEIRGKTLPYVSRGGLKLAHALEVFGVEVSGKTCIDCGASTGGFTDCLLQKGAAHVYAVDVGYGQLAWSLRQDPRVTVLERTNIRYLTPADLPTPIDFSVFADPSVGDAPLRVPPNTLDSPPNTPTLPQLAVIDLSFISLRLVLPAVYGLLTETSQAIALIKPQFEAGREQVGKKGVVRDPNVHSDVLARFLEDAVTAGFGVSALTHSPIRGPEGNIEYLAHLEKDKPSAPDLDPQTVVEGSHNHA
ncbi:MAG: TlyA family RNA methyltransferase [Oscillospiraceae bacterium]|nr:TlyA family RNA methyltransferase [Oscillospiraceae bacterium]